MNEESAAATVSMAKGEYDDLMKLKVELRQRRVEDKVKAVGKNKAIWRQTMVLRRVDLKKYAPDEDLVAYGAIHGLRKSTGDQSKISVTDNEINAYKMLDPDFNKIVSLSQLLEKVDELKNAGILTAVGDNAGNVEDIIEE